MFHLKILHVQEYARSGFDKLQMSRRLQTMLVFFKFVLGKLVSTWQMRLTRDRTMLINFPLHSTIQLSNKNAPRALLSWPYLAEDTTMMTLLGLISDSFWLT